MDDFRRQSLLLTQSQQARNPLPPLMESEYWENPPTPPPKDARYSQTDNTAMEFESGSAPASGSKRKREVQDFDGTVYERRNGRLEAVGDRDQDLPTPQKRSRSHDDNATPVQRRHGGSLRRKRGFGNLSNMNLRHAAANAFRSESPTRESRFQEGSLNDKPSQQPPSVFTRVTRTDSGNLQQVDELMNDYHEGMTTPRDSTEDYEKATIEYEKVTMPARVAEITEQQRKKEAGKHGIFRFGRSFTNTFHPVQLWNKMWSESREELIAKSRLEAERKAREKAEIQARYDQMKRDGQFNTQHVPFAGMSRVDAVESKDTVMVDSVQESSGPQRDSSLGSPPLQGNAVSIAESETHDAPGGLEVEEMVPATATKTRFPGFHFKTPSISNLRETFRSVRSVRSHSALGGAVGRDSSASASVSPAKPDTSTLKRSISRLDLKKERRLSNRVSDLESKLNKARLELKNALDDASPMPKLGNRYERFTPVGTMKRSRFVPGALATLPSERLLFPEMSASDATNESAMAGEANTNSMEDKLHHRDAVKAQRDEGYQASATEVSERNRSIELDKTARTTSVPRVDSTVGGTEPVENEDGPSEVIPDMEEEQVSASDPPAIKDALTAKLGALEASYKASSKSAKSRKRRSAAFADDEKLYRPSKEEEDESESEALAPKKKRKSAGKPAGSAKKKPAGSKAGKKTSIPVPVADSKGKKSKKAPQAVDNFFTNGNTNGNPAGSEGDSSDELATAAPPSADSDAQSLDPVYEEEEEVTTIPLKDEPSKPTAKSTPARYGRDVVHPRANSTHPKRSDSLQPAVDAAPTHAGQAAPQRRSAGRSPGYNGQRAEVVEEAIVAVPGENGVPSLPVGAKSNSNWSWPEDVF